MPDNLKGSKNAKDFDRGMNAGGGNPLDFAAKAIKKVFGSKEDASSCPHCGQAMPSESPSPNPINYPPGSSL